MTETLLVDYAFSRPSVAQIKAVGAVGVMRYLTRNTGDLKVLTRGEAYAYRADGLMIGVVFEDGAGRALLGEAAGMADAEFATAQALAIGVPTSCPIFYAVDVETTPDQVSAYFVGAQKCGTFPVGVYGSCAVVDGLLSRNLAAWGWQTGAWSGGRVSQLAHLYQRITPTKPVPGCDENVLLRPFPLWGHSPMGGVPGVGHRGDSAPGGGNLPGWYVHLMSVQVPLLRGGDVRHVQEQLHMGGFIDGAYGPTTKQWVTDFQRKHGLGADGVVGPETAKAIG